MSPFPFAVTERDCVAEPKEPTLEFTVARVYALVLFAEPSNVEPALVTSPVAVPIVRAVCRAVAVQALPVTLVWSQVFVPERLRAEASVLPFTVGIFVLSISVNHPFVIRVPVAPRLVKKPVAHFIREEPILSVLSVSETREVLIATLARFERAVLAGV